MLSYLDYLQKRISTFAEMETNESKLTSVIYGCEQAEESTFFLTETPTSKAEQTKVESTNDNKSESLTHTERNTGKKKRTARSQSGTGIEQRKQIFRIFLKVLGSAANPKSNVWLLIFLTISPFSTTYGQDLGTSIETSPIILGKDATFKGSIEQLHNETSLASPGWLKGQGNAKDKIIYSNISTKGGKYTPKIFNETDSFIYLMTIHNVSLSDLDIYTCEIGFNQSTVSFTMKEYLPFIYFPANNDTVYSISKTEMNVLIERKCPWPYCIALYNDKDITKWMKKVDNREATTYSTKLPMVLRECNGNLYKSWILGLKSFKLTKKIQQCTNGIKSSAPKQTPTGMKTVIIAIVIILIIV